MYAQIYKYKKCLHNSWFSFGIAQEPSKLRQNQIDQFQLLTKYYTMLPKVGSKVRVCFGKFNLVRMGSDLIANWIPSVLSSLLISLFSCVLPNPVCENWIAPTLSFVPCIRVTLYGTKSNYFSVLPWKK